MTELIDNQKRKSAMSGYDKITEELEKQNINPLYNETNSSAEELESRFVYSSHEERENSIYDCLAKR